MFEHNHKTYKNVTMKSHVYQGGCHCHKVRYQIKLPQTLEQNKIVLCNCSICEKTGYLHLIIPQSQMTLLTDWQQLHNYQFNTKVAKHFFCKNCGIKSFYQPRSHPDCWSINVRSIDQFYQYHLQIENFDGKNWEQNITQIQ